MANTWSLVTNPFKNMVFNVLLAPASPVELQPLGWGELSATAVWECVQWIVRLLNLGRFLIREGTSLSVKPLLEQVRVKPCQGKYCHWL